MELTRINGFHLFDGCLRTNKGLYIRLCRPIRRPIQTDIDLIANINNVHCRYIRSVWSLTLFSHSVFNVNTFMSTGRIGLIRAFSRTYHDYLKGTHSKEITLTWKRFAFILTVATLGADVFL